MKNRKKWASVLGLVLLPLGLAGCCLLNSSPQVNFTWSPMEPLARTQVQFTDLSTDPNGGITSRLWEFGDGTTGAGSNPTHEYQMPGSYVVRLTVTDSCGASASLQKTINVGASLDGRWVGDIWDALNNRFQLELALNQSGPGTLVGTAYVTGLSCPIMSATFNPSSREVRIMFAYAVTGNTWLLVGTYEPATDCISGYWENVTLAPGTRIGDWHVCRQ